MKSVFLAAVPAASSFDPTQLLHYEGTPIMIASCLLVLLIASRTIRFPHVGPKMPLPFPSLFNNISVAGFLASMSFGHIVGVLAILGFSGLLQK